MKNSMLSNRWFAPGCFQSGVNFNDIVRSHAKVLLAAIALVTPLGMSRAARADSYNFSVNGSGIQASGVIQVSNIGPLGVLGGYTVTGIDGSFSDSTNGISGAITGLELPKGDKVAPSPHLNPTPVGTTDPAANTFLPPAGTTAGFSYDDLFWPGADSPAVCPEALAFHGGYFDVYGMAFDVAGGYTADLWSDGGLGGYQLNDSIDGVPFTPNNMAGLAYAVDVSASPVPEPGSLLLVGTGLSGMAALWNRRKMAI